jgi:ribosomal protein L37AE/L43A
VYGATELKSEEVTMSAIAEVSSQPRSASRGSDRPVCQVCADTMVAAEASAFLSDDLVSHLWSCETCGYGFVTKHSLKQPKARRTFSAA